METLKKKLQKFGKVEVLNVDPEYIDLNIHGEFAGLPSRQVLILKVVQKFHPEYTKVKDKNHTISRFNCRISK